MNNNVILRRLDYKEQHQIINIIESDVDLVNTFSGDKNTRSRIANSIYVAKIENKSLTIGFLMIVNNPKTNINEIDMGILKKYRNQGYGTKALQLLKDLIIKNNIQVEIQIKKDNIGAIKSVTNNLFSQYKNDDDCNYYTLSQNNKK